MNPNPGLAQLVSFPNAGRRIRWYEEAMSASPRRKVAVNWDKMLGMATLLALSGVGWSAAGFAVAHFLR